MNTQVHDRWIGDVRATVVLQDGEVEAVMVGNHYLSLDDWNALMDWVEGARNGYFDTGENDDE